ncbi:MAG: cytochrome c biogenesis protein CcsA [Chloroflexota bacterium]|nr:cytochrome c biogenesis protein CcsA [Chloroflexota bacterium]
MSTTTLSQRTAVRFHGWDFAQLLLNLLTVAGVAALMWAALVYAKPATNLEGVEQTAQRIFYIHMACNFGALAGFLTSLTGSLVYLITRKLDWDRVTQASIEVGTICALGTTLTGALWAKPTWNTYWTWDPRLTMVTITLLIYIAYLLLRNGIDNRQTRARFGSIYALFAFLSVPLTYYSARWFRTIHPVVFNGENPEAQGGFAVGPTMSQTLTVSVISFCLLFSALMIVRWRQLRLEDRIAELREEVE